MAPWDSLKHSRKRAACGSVQLLKQIGSTPAFLETLGAASGSGPTAALVISGDQLKFGMLQATNFAGRKYGAKKIFCLNPDLVHAIYSVNNCCGNGPGRTVLWHMKAKGFTLPCPCKGN